MKTTYDWDERTETHICQACGYKHTKKTSYVGTTIEGDDEFIEMEDILHSRKSYSSVCSHRVYACPKCGVLQIEV